MKRFLRAAASVAIAVAVLSIAACGGGGGGETSGGGQTEGAAATTTSAAKPTKLTIGLIPIVDVAPVILGVQQGFFSDEGLQVDTQFASGGAAIVPAVVSGDFQIGFSNNVSLILGREKGLPLQIVFAGDDEATKPAKAVCHIYVLADSPVKKPADLAGKTIAVNTLKNVGDITVKESLSKHGVDPDSVKLVEMPFPEMLSALQKGQVDAIWTAEPFSTNAEEAGARAIIAPQVETSPGLAIASYFASDSYVAEHPDVIERFQNAMRKSFAYVNEHPEAVRTAITDYAKLPKAVANKIQLPVWNPDLDREKIALLSKLSVKYGLIDREPNIDQLVPQ